MTKQRQLRKQEEIRRTILDAARQIVLREGVQGLSIRKITSAIEYSPAIIYHYFKDKNEIVESLVGEGYAKILDSIRTLPKNIAEPELELKEMFTRYIRAALEAPEEYKAFMLQEDPAVLSRTSLLARGISETSPTMQALSQVIERGIRLNRFAAADPELTAQILWTSTFGLLMKLILEKNVTEEQTERLIERHFELLFQGLLGPLSPG
ncbi:TetR/AcrR family transcriptional regulator [Gorillibacterium sp. sgz5001074]|uniref:TetR/AcrR family transcriptional regulator n=1 Tax=Gorillibacterium sp. sgz5001074 TaxID=3446695 RepID=UPI003F674A3B